MNAGTTVSDDEKVATLRRLVEAFNRQDVDAALELFAEDAVFESSAGPDPWGRRFRGADELRDALMRAVAPPTVDGEPGWRNRQTQAA